MNEQPTHYETAAPQVAPSAMPSGMHVLGDRAHPSVFRTLRALMPSRTLTFHEALERAELQANRLLQLHGVEMPGTPTEIVSALPRVRIERQFDMPVSGSAHWEAPFWVLRLNAGESDARQRFSLMHEFKHVLDHPFAGRLETSRSMSAEVMTERIADYFAACVLMPKRLVKTAFCSRTQSIEDLAALFMVSPKAMHVRLSQLGLLTPVDRCAPALGQLIRPLQSVRRTYFRSLPTLEGALA